jgi:hypothetical protein
MGQQNRSDTFNSMGTGRLAGKISKSVLGKRARKGLKIRRQMPAFSAYGMAVNLILKSPTCNFQNIPDQSFSIANATSS